MAPTAKIGYIMPSIRCLQTVCYSSKVYVNAQLKILLIVKCIIQESQEADNREEYNTNNKCKFKKMPQICLQHNSIKEINV